MKQLLYSLVFVGLGLAGPVWAEAVQVADSKASFEPPPGFGPVPQAIIDAKWPGNRAPRFVVGNERATTTVAYDLKPNTVPQDKLPEVQKAFTGLMERVVPGLRWVRNEIIEQAGQRWLYLELTSNAVDTDIHNMMLITGLGGQMLVFNFNSTKEEFPKLETALRASMRSIAIAR
ncbi:MAG: hypothetical protein WEK74_14500 [Hydrogenophaga sp.]